ncbi:MAG TPA: response regulator [Roseiflexaceae bacterium]|nr:response regulator [Roseiflexaceae bacterium]
MTTKIMVVDDEPAIGKLLLYQLSGFGYQVSYIQDGLSALHRLTSERPDLVLLDVMMPQISGWDICREIRACSAVPVIMLTAKGADPDIVTGLQAGADDYITKPFSMAQLQARIEAVLRRATPLAQGRAAARHSTHAEPGQTVVMPPRQERALASDSAAPAPTAGRTLRLGQHIHETRLSQGLSLHQVERACKIRWEFLQAIEQENWDYVPRTELRRALRVYTQYLGLNLQSLIGRPKKRRAQLFAPFQYAAALALVMMLLVVGLYLF